MNFQVAANTKNLCLPYLSNIFIPYQKPAPTWGPMIFPTSRIGMGPMDSFPPHHHRNHLSSTPPLPPPSQRSRFLQCQTFEEARWWVELRKLLVGWWMFFAQRGWNTSQSKQGRHMVIYLDVEYQLRDVCSFKLLNECSVGRRWWPHPGK